jgi:hypothetical protein
MEYSSPIFAGPILSQLLNGIRQLTRIDPDLVAVSIRAMSQHPEEERNLNPVDVIFHSAKNPASEAYRPTCGSPHFKHVFIVEALAGRAMQGILEECCDAIGTDAFVLVADDAVAGIIPRCHSAHYFLDPAEADFQPFAYLPVFEPGEDSAHRRLGHKRRFPNLIRRIQAA